MRFLHTMIRVRDLDASLAFFCDLLGLEVVRRDDYSKGRFSLIFLAAPGDADSVATDKALARRESPTIELTWNWDPEDYGSARNFGHLAFEVDDIYAACDRLMAGGVTMNRPPRDGHMAFVRSPDLVSVELLQKGEPKAPAEPWASMPNTGVW